MSIASKPKIKRRKINAPLAKAAMATGLSPTLAAIFSSRVTVAENHLDSILYPRLKHLSSPNTLKDAKRAAERLAQAIIKGEVIGIETDHDCDGQTSHAIIYSALLKDFKHPKDKLRSYIGHRLQEGYGLSMALAKRILADEPRPSLIITADNGSSDEERIALLKAAKIDVIVSDHHALPEDSLPLSAYACVNPSQIDCQYPDPLIAGCMVAWLIMTLLRQSLMDKGYLASSSPKLKSYLDWVALGTVADCVSIARSPNNRAVVLAGLQLINLNLRPCWQVIRAKLKRDFNCEDLGFTIGPLLNSDGRLSNALTSLQFLLADNTAEAEALYHILHEQNTERRSIQKRITQAGMLRAAEITQETPNSLCIYLADGHPGVHGIAASRIKDMYGRPTVFISPKHNQADILTGSARAIDGFDVVAAFKQIKAWAPDCLLAFGGHKGAGGLSLNFDQLERFRELFERAASLQLKPQDLGPQILSDGPLPGLNLNLEFLNNLNALEPFGREFETPLFEARAQVVSFKLIGNLEHAKLNLLIDSRQVEAMWFNCLDSLGQAPNIEVESKIDIVFKLKSNVFRGQTSLVLHLVHVLSLD